jgi:hypothetical protein
MERVIVGRIYQHFKGNLYLVTGVSTQAEFDVEEVEYVALYGECKKYTRRRNSFASEYDKNFTPIAKRKDNVTGQTTCFKLVGEEYGCELKEIRK